jgi:hypothetical protein
MNERNIFGRELDTIEHELRDLHTIYEQYFAGVEKREPVKKRAAVAQRLRTFANRRIQQTDLRFRYQNLATRFQSYVGYWDRILRLMDEGRYVRQLHKIKGLPAATATATAPAADKAVATPAPLDETETVFRQLQQARESCRLDPATLNRQQVEAFLEKQKEAIRQRFGDRPVDFRVVIEDGKPKVKVRPRN